MFHVVLVEPEIAPNVGNVARLCAATGTHLHLVGRLGFRLDDRKLKRAGLDYWHAVQWTRHVTWETFVEEVKPVRLWKFAARAERGYWSASFATGDFLVFGAESRGLPTGILAQQSENNLAIPMAATGVRSLNLATAVGIALYEALRQTTAAATCATTGRPQLPTPPRPGTA